MASLSHPDYTLSATCPTRGCGNTIAIDTHNECKVCDRVLCEDCTYECRGCGAHLCVEHSVVDDLGDTVAIECRGCAVLGSLSFALAGVL